MKPDLLVRGGKVVLPGLEMRDLDVAIQDGRILALIQPGKVSNAEKIISAEGKLVLPGGIDAHTHLTIGPGAHGYETETRSAALGGITTALSFLLSGGDLEEVIQDEIDAAGNRVHIDYGLHPGIVTEDQLLSLERIVKRFGAISFKFFMSARGNEMAYIGVPGSDDGFLFKLLRAVGRLPGVIPCVHAENIELVWMLRSELQSGGDGGLMEWEKSRPDYAEAEATHRALYFAEKAHAPLYVVHITCREALEVVRAARNRRPGKVFAETCLHYLTMTCEKAPSPAAKVNPPLRYDDDVEALWEAVADGTIDVVGSDHAARRFNTKEGGIWKSSAGFPGVASLLPLFLTEGARRGLPLPSLVDKVTHAPAAIFGLAPHKGSLIPGAFGDLTIVDPDGSMVISHSRSGSYADYTPYEGQSVSFIPTHTVVRGNVVVEDGELVGKPGMGKYLKRGEHFTP